MGIINTCRKLDVNRLNYRLADNQQAPIAIPVGTAIGALMFWYSFSLVYFAISFVPTHGINRGVWAAYA